MTFGLKNISIKSKSLIFVLTLISVLFLIMYYQNKMSHKSYLKQVEAEYTQSFNNYYASFTNDMLKYYSTQVGFFSNKKIVEYIQTDDTQSLMQHVDFVFNNLKPSNRYLKNVSFITANSKWAIDRNEIRFDTDLYKTYNPLFEKINNKDRNLVDLIVKNDEVYYRLLLGVFSDNELLGVAEFLINAEVLLKSINNFDGSKGFIFFKTYGEVFKRYIHIEDESSSELRQVELKHINDNKIFKMKDKYFVAKVFSLKNLNKKLVAKTIFFLDVTSKNISYEKSLQKSIYFSIILFLLASFIVNYIFHYLITRVEISESKLKILNKDLEKRVKDEIDTRMSVELQAFEEKKEKEQMLVNQSKLASMGEMIGNIAHQWRQPLMQMSAVLMYLEAYNENKELTTEKLLDKVNEGNNLIQFMSGTIEDFRNFYKPDKKKEKFLVEDILSKALVIVNASLSSHNIHVNIQIFDEKMTINGYQNEFSQALLNIISNAKDVLVQRNIKQPVIFISLYKENNKNVIEICDNAGGIELNILDKVFDPYFTTKHAYQGTGIGLYMTKMIIEKNMQGSINVSNKESGACFKTII